MSGLNSNDVYEYVYVERELRHIYVEHLAVTKEQIEEFNLEHCSWHVPVAGALGAQEQQLLMGATDATGINGV